MGVRGVLRTADGGRLLFRCPGCDELHPVTVGAGAGPRWSWNGDHERPTFSPSVLVTGHQLELEDDGKWTGAWKLDAAGDPLPSVCHSFVTDGRIAFLNDCTHALAGQVVELLPPELSRDG